MICKEIEATVDFWINSNDISSPSHVSEIGSLTTNLSIFDGLTENQAAELDTKLVGLLDFIRDLSKKQ